MEELQNSCVTQGFLVAVSDNSHAGSRHRFDNGMSMFYLLSDGTFLIYDGGQGKEDAENLFALLQKTAQENRLSRIVVSLWILTHEHGDHVGFANHFFSTYGKEIELREVWLDPVVDTGVTIKALIEQNCADCIVRKAVIGETLQLADVRIEVLCTAEALLAYDADAIKKDFNNASIVTRLTVGDQSVLMSADAGLVAWDFMVERYGENLKSDILQVPHHGANYGAKANAYALVDAKMLLFNCSEELHLATVEEGRTYACYPNCLHNLYNPETAALVKDFAGTILLAGAYDCNHSVCTCFLKVDQ